MKRICSINDCGKPAKTNGLCGAHYMRWRRYGDPSVCHRPMPAAGEIDRFYREIVLTYDGDECLCWPYARSGDGYGAWTVGGVMRGVHRLVCEEVNGPAPTSEHQAAHSCGKGHLACVTKRHLSWKTPAGNAADTIIHGTNPSGERNNAAKLTEPDVRQILALKGKLRPAAIADRFGVCRATVSHILNGRTWASLQ